MDSGGFAFSEMIYKTWQERYQQLWEFKKKHKKLPISNKNSRNKSQKSLARWLTLQREYKRNGKLPKERIKLLESIGMIWDRKNDRRKWDNIFNKLKQFRKINPDKWPSWNAKDKTERSLAIWCHFNRTWCRGTREEYSKYPKDRKQILDSIGFIWNPGDWDKRWLERYKEFKKYRKENPNRWPPLKMKRLHNWMRSQREIYRTGRLSEERIDLLDEIGFNWNPRNK